MRERVVQPEADDISRIALTRYGMAQIAAGALERGSNGGRRVHERAVPVENQKLKSLPHWLVRVFPESQPAPAATGLNTWRLPSSADERWSVCMRAETSV